MCGGGEKRLTGYTGRMQRFEGEEDKRGREGGKKSGEGLRLALVFLLTSTSAVSLAAQAPSSPGDQLKDDLLSALLNLGYLRPAAEKAVDSVLKRASDTSFEQALKETLRTLMKR